MKWLGASLAIVAALTGCTHAWNKGYTEDPYLPEVRALKKDVLTGETEVAYHFSNGQLSRMARTRLDTNRFIAYVEHRWPIERLRDYCTATNVWDGSYQNLLAENCPIKADLHKGKATGFDTVWVYVSQDNGRGINYFGEAGTKWHRWDYSVNMQRGPSHWVIIEQLPNDFVDSAKFDPGNLK